MCKYVFILLFLITVKFWARTIIDKKQFGRMPWHDVSIGFVSIITFNRKMRIFPILYLRVDPLRIFTGWQTYT